VFPTGDAGHPAASRPITTTAVLRPSSAPTVPVATFAEHASLATEPLLVAGHDGTITALWSVWDGLRSSLRSAVRSPAGAWAEPVSAASGTGSPRVLAGADGSLTAIWPGSTMLIARREPRTGTWSVRTVQASFLASIFRPTIATTASGALVVLWSAGRRISERTLRPAARVWSAARQIAVVPGGASVSFSNVLASGSDRVTVAWSASGGQSCLGAWVATSGARWVVRRGLPVTTAEIWCGQPVLVQTRSGALLLASAAGAPAVLREDRRSGRWSEPITLGDGPWLPAPGSTLAVGPDDTVHVVAEQDAQVIVGSLTAAGVRAPFRPVAPAVETPTQIGSPLGPTIAVAPNGTEVVAWPARDRSGDVVVRVTTRKRGGQWMPLASLPVGDAVVALTIVAASDSRTATLAWTTAPLDDALSFRAAAVRATTIRLP
jgi:hypothetical protein